MSGSRQRWAWVGGVMGVAAVVFLLGINWGLPSRRVDPYLFGSETPWPGQRIAQAAGGWESGALGADVDRNPIAAGNQPVLLNGSDRQRAEIIRRFRLYSYQPDEMITLRALGQMRSGGGGRGWDPRLYQYGGLWIYPVGAMLKAASMVGLITVRGDLSYYYDNPEAFGRFYIVARFYTVLWGIAGAWAVFWLARRLTEDDLLAGAAALAYVFLPVVMNGAHEAKPHLPGAVLMLLAASAAVRYVETGKWAWGLGAGALCGAAVGMVLSSLLIFLVIPVMAWRRGLVRGLVRGLMRGRGGESMGLRIGIAAAAVVLGAVVYLVSNPYVPINWLNPDSEGGRALRSNLGNSQAMYRISPLGVRDAIVLLGLGTSPLLALLGLAGAGVVVALAARAGERGKRTEKREQRREQGEEGREARVERRVGGVPPAVERRAPAPPPRASVGPRGPRSIIPPPVRVVIPPTPVQPPAPPGPPRSSVSSVLSSFSANSPASHLAWLLLIPAGAVAVQFALLAAGKPAEYARFGMLPDIALVLLAAWGAAKLSRGNAVFRQLLAALVVVAALPYGLAYCRAFVRDCGAMNTRLAAADELFGSGGRILLYREPAPYNCPPLNLFHRDIVLIPEGRAQEFARAGDILLFPVDVPLANTPQGARRLPFKEAPGSLDQFTTPIAWANKTFAGKSFAGR